MKLTQFGNTIVISELLESKDNMDIKTLQLYLLSNYPFYYALLQQARINLDSNSEHIAFVKVQTRIEITINPEKFALFTIPKQAGILIHELLHIYKGHIQQTINKAVDNLSNALNIMPNYMLANICMDMEVNPYISELIESKAFGPKAAKNSEYKGCWPQDYQLDERNSWTNYYTTLVNQSTKQKAPDHSYFLDSTHDAKMIEEITVNAAKRAKNLAAGQIPYEIEKYLLDYEANKTIPWYLVLRQFIQSLVDVTSKNTWKKRSRRFPRLLPGIKKLPKLKLLIGIDSSGSVGDKDLSKFYTEVDCIKNSANVDIDIAVFDTDIHQREKYTKGFEAKRVCSGGTSFIPVHQLALEERFKGVIYLTDGYAEFPNKDEVNYKCLWVLNTSIVPPYGNVVRIK